LEYFPPRLVVVLAGIASGSKIPLRVNAEIVWVIIIVVIVRRVIIVIRVSVSIPIISAAIQKLHVSINANVQIAAAVFPFDNRECATEAAFSSLSTLMANKKWF
jgi:hypothetical protein